MTRELVSQYFGVDLRSGREVVRDFIRNSVANVRLMWQTIFPTHPPPTSTSPASPAIPSSPPTPRKLAVGLVIAMPNPSHPHYYPHPATLPEDASAPTSPISQGKRRATGDQADLEDEYEGIDLPDIAFGLIEAPWAPEEPPTVVAK